MKYLYLLLRKLYSFFNTSLPTVMTTKRSEYQPAPSDISSQQIVIVQSGKILKSANFQCPGGCGENIRLNLSTNRKPHWTINVDWLSRPTMKPSVRQTNHCNCHFWITRGQVIWCCDS